MFGRRLPAYGFYCRHVKGLKLLNIQLQLANPDQRQAVVFEDVEDALIDDLTGPYPKWADSTIQLNNVRKVYIRSKNN
jgi:hypothetical protein